MALSALPAGGAAGGAGAEAALIRMNLGVVLADMDRTVVRSYCSPYRSA